ncbi:MAG: hypothetical protein R3E98_20225 [Gemmatimonadota bacterium]|nr:hypothetical protein [Gemmatimonadota bacterium]
MTPPARLVFGGVLQSDLDFPELPPAPAGAAPHWVLTTRTDTPPERVGARTLGADEVDQGVQVSLLGDEHGFRLSYSDTGTFDIAERGSRITWYPGPEAKPETARVDILGRVLAVALHARGDLTLHASAVAFGRGAIGFIAPKHHGKSTTALALVRSGARLVTDDTLGVTMDEDPLAIPGVHAVRLWNDSAELVGPADAAVDGSGPGGKLLLSDLPSDCLMIETTPLRALYLLAPVQAGEGVPAVERVALQSFDATLALLTQTKIGALLGGAEAGTVLDRVARIADKVPVYRLHVARDFARLDELVDTLRAWHADLVAAPAS